MGEFFENSNPFKNGRRYHNIGSFLKSEFGTRVIKLAIDGGFTCPNRDGTCGTGGCIFCSQSGSGEFTGEKPMTMDALRTNLSITDQIESQFKVMTEKWPEGKYIVYFQSFTNTYDTLDNLRKRYEEALSYPGVVGLAIATRPDSLNDDVLDLLMEYNKKTYLWIELGLQTVHEKTAKLINRCYPLSVYDDAIERLLKRNIKVVTHLIFGLPGESAQDMMTSVKHVVSKPIFGIKLQLMQILKGTLLGEIYTKKDSYNYEAANLSEYVDELQSFESLTSSSYANLIADALEIIPRKVTIHRITGDPPKPSLIQPTWCLDKRKALNAVNEQLKTRNSWQGSKL